MMRSIIVNLVGAMDIKMFLIGIIMTPFVTYLYEHVLQEYYFAINLIVLVAIDSVLGFYCAYRLKQVSSEGFSRVISKVVVYLLLLVATHSALDIRLNKFESILEWIDSLVYSLIAIRELISIFEKTAILGIFKLPIGILKRLKYFDDNGEHIKNDNN